MADITYYNDYYGPLCAGLPFASEHNPVLDLFRESLTETMQLVTISQAREIPSETDGRIKSWQTRH
ncbi:hypothetical protein SAMN05216308_101545 [Nitrosospira sp. Nsp13]|nr:hypothetical protein SAMN05216308_101545 [Nitrosospira sp. Nsp13]